FQASMLGVDVGSVDQATLLAYGAWIHRLKMYPYFDTAHYLLVTCEIRDEMSSAAGMFSRKHPLSCWLSTMLMCFADSFLASFLLGEPLITPFKRHDDILLATLIWYLVFYAPFDAIYKMTKITPVKVVLSIMKEFKRAHKVAQGVSHAAKLYPHSYLVQILIGTAKGAGTGVVRPIEQFVRGVWMPTHNELLRPSLYTKVCLIASTLLVLEANSPLINAPHDLVYLGMLGFLLYFKLAYLLFHVSEPFAPFENLFCAVAMGGIWDALSRAIAASRERKAANKDSVPLPGEKKEQ
ncbi:hypothetical protein PMAYCL1PPCAC_09816, partial [Pristionchus mayeri]